MNEEDRLRSVYREFGVPFVVTWTDGESVVAAWADHEAEYRVGLPIEELRRQVSLASLELYQ